MEDQQKSKLFREKSLKAIESPEALNDYLRVTSPGVWLVLAAVIALLAGMILWSIFGRIDTSIRVAVAAGEEGAVCFIPYDALEGAVKSGEVTVDGQAYALRPSADSRMTVISEETDPYVRITGSLTAGDVTVEVPVDAALDKGVYAGTIVTERLQPITLLLQ